MKRGFSKLPTVCFVTPDFSACKADPLPRLRTLLQSGIRLVQYRCQVEDSPAWGRRLAATIALCREYQAALIVNAEAPVGERFGADGIHLNSARLLACARRPVSDRCWFSASCHDPRELRHAASVSADFVTLSPVAPSRSHPGARPLGWGRFRDWVRESSLPVYALGGLQTSDLVPAQKNGAYGIAMISGLWSRAAPCVGLD